MVSKRATKKVLEADDEQLRDYELVYIISPEVTEEKIGATIDNVTQFITGKGGIVSDVEQWGKKKLSYPIKRSTEGNYVLTRFKLQPKLTKELKANLQISEEFLRHLLIKFGD
ncbi:30S ribosomal protein S6 [Chloroflexota bacterium]